MVRYFKKRFSENGPILRRVLIHKRIKNIVDNNDKLQKEKLYKVFILAALVIDIAQSEECLESLFQLISKVHEQMNIVKEQDLDDLIARIQFNKNK